MECINATRLRRKSGPWGTQHLLLRDVASPLRGPQSSTGGEDGREQVECERSAQVRFGAVPGTKPKESCPPVAMYSFWVL
jgi:hypothetical protein